MLNLSERSLTWAINSVLRHFDTYLFPMPFEYEAIGSKKAEVIAYLKSIDVFDQGIREYRTALAPRSTRGFRIATQLDPIDSIISHAIMYEISDELEKPRIPKSEGTVFSFRLKPQKDGTIYDPDYNWEGFINKASNIIESEEYSHVLVTDIADFYPSIYLHDIETVLSEAVAKSGRITHVQTLINYLKAMHLNQTHKGLPVGPQFSRPIAELILNEIDQTLVDKGITYVRYVDDYIVFAKSESEAYIHLANLAQSLYDRRNLKLNEYKTELLTIDRFTEKHLKTPKKIESDSILSHFGALLSELGLDDDPYEEIDPEQLSPSDWEKLRAVNLKELLETELMKDNPDNTLVTFLLANLARIDNTEIALLLLKEANITKLFPRLRAINGYLERVRSFSSDQKDVIGKRVLNLVNNSFIGSIEFSRMWMLNLFTKNNEWNNADVFERMLAQYKDNLSIRELYLALGRSRNVAYFRKAKASNLDTNGWTRRAFIAAISCLPDSERTPWFKARALRSRDFLDKIVETWALNKHF